MSENDSFQCELAGRSCDDPEDEFDEDDAEEAKRFINQNMLGSENAGDIVVLNQRMDNIQVVLGEGVHNVRCDLVPTRNGSAYVGNALGRELGRHRAHQAQQAGARGRGRGPRPWPWPRSCCVPVPMRW